jgi:hypothetical protein
VGLLKFIAQPTKPYPEPDDHFNNRTLLIYDRQQHITVFADQQPYMY